jgi:uncharacterized protein
MSLSGCIERRIQGIRKLISGWRTAALVISLLALQGCAATTTFTSYTGKMKPLLGDLESGRTIDLSQCLVPECQSQDAILYRMERGRIAQIMGHVGDSMKDFESSMVAIRASDEKALVSASDIAAQMAAIAVNDNAIPYKGEGYERVMLYQFQAMNYLYQKNVEEAGTEVRRANAEQEEALRRHEKELDDAREEAERKHVQVRDEGRLAAQFARLDELAGKVKNSFQNAYTFYLSGLVYELLKQPNDAYIDYRKAQEIFPGNSYLKQDVSRLARALGMDDDQPGAGRVDKEERDRSAAGEKAGSGELIVFFEDGFVPQKEEVKIPIPVPNAGLVAIAFPIYSARWTTSPPITLVEGGQRVGTMEPICHVRALAVKALKERVPAMIIRQTIRAVAKGASAKKAKEKYGVMGEFTSSLYNLASENADLRSWTTLPGTVQLLRAVLPAGEHTLSMQQGGVTLPAGLSVSIPGGGKTVLRVIRVGNRIYTMSQSF